MTRNPLAVFTKPWKELSLPELGRFVADLGFNGIEFPLREGFQIEPAEAETKLPQLVKVMRDYNLEVYSVAADTDERIFAACAAAGVPIIRIMVRIDEQLGYLATEDQVRRELEERVVPFCRKYGIKVGIQPHYGNFVCNAMGVKHLIESFDPATIGAIWDSGHCALSGEEPELGLDVVWSHLCMVNLKNAFYQRMNGPEAEWSEWKPYFTTGRHGLASWPRVIAYLQRRNYRGVLCLTAEYTDKAQVNRLIKEDLAYLKSLLQ